MERWSRIEQVRAAQFTSGRGRETMLVGDPGLYPGANTMNSEFTRGLHGLGSLGSAAILTTDLGVEEVRRHFLNVIHKQPWVDFVTTPTWNTSPVIFSRLQDSHGLPRGETAETLTRRGVRIVRETLRETGSDATMLLSVRPTGNTVDGSGTLSSLGIKRMFREQLKWLVEAADGRPSVLTLETEPTLRGARAFAEVAEEMKHPYIVTLRPTDKGKMPDGSPYDKIVGEIAGEYLVAGGFNCQTIFAIENAMHLARKKGAESLTMIAAPNGTEGYNENIDGLTATQADRIRTDNIDGLRRLQENGTIIFAGCCNSIPDDIVLWERELREGFALSKIVFEPEAARRAERWVYRGAGVR